MSSKPKYVTFGLEELDKDSHTELGDVVVIGSYPGVGKTALAIMMALHMAKEYRVGYFSLEMSYRNLFDRIIAHVAQVDLADVKYRKLDEAAWDRLARQQADIAKLDLTMVETAGMSAAEIETYSRTHGFQVIFVDYIQLVTPEKTAGVFRSEQMAGVSRAMRAFAQKTGTLVVELSQLTRPDRGKGAKKRAPTIHDLKDSRQFEKDADMVLLLSRPGPGEGVKLWGGKTKARAPKVISGCFQIAGL